MIAGQLTPRDAVPISKCVVFLGSLSSLFLNLKKVIVSDAGASTTSVIDFNICRLVVPCALLGTFVGVILNSHMEAWVTVVMLGLVLVGITTISARTFLKQRQQEQ